MRRPVNWLVIALALAFLLVGRSLRAPSPEVVISKMGFEPTVAVAIPAALRRESNPEFGYVTLEALPTP